MEELHRADQEEHDLRHEDSQPDEALDPETVHVQAEEVRAGPVQGSAGDLAVHSYQEDAADAAGVQVLARPVQLPARGSKGGDAQRAANDETTHGGSLLRLGGLCRAEDGKHTNGGDRGGGARGQKREPRAHAEQQAQATGVPLERATDAVGVGRVGAVA